MKEINQTLILGNCEDCVDDIIRSCDSPIIVTDPPFNIGYHYNQYKDNMNEDDYYEWLSSLLYNCPSVIIHYPESLYKLAFQMGQFPEKIISWVYPSNTAKQHRDIAFFGVMPDMKKVRQPYRNPNDKRVKELIAKGNLGGRLYDWWEINQVKNVSKEKTGHPCQMPVEVMKRIVGILPENATIVDPFMGSGTTGVACKMLGRNFIGVEMDKMYYDIARNRIENTQEDNG